MSGRSQRLVDRTQRKQSQAIEDQQKKTALWKQRRREAPKSKDIIKQKKRDAARARRLAIKEQSELYNLHKQKERERWRQRRQAGKVLARDKMTERELRVARRKGRESVKRHRERKNKKSVQSEIDVSDAETCGEEQSDNPPISSASAEQVAVSGGNKRNLSGKNNGNESVKSVNIEVNKTTPESINNSNAMVTPLSPSLSVHRSSETVAEMKKKGRKKKSAQRTAAHREIARKNKTITTLQRALWRCRRQLTLTKRKIPLTPRSQVRKDTKGKNIDPQVRKKLEFGEVLKMEVNNSLENKSVKVKKAGYQIIKGSFLKKYKLQFTSGLSARLLRRGRKKVSDPLDQTRAESKKKVSRVQEVQKFFLKDENSIECADKKAVKILFGKGKIQKRKRYLRGTMKDLYVSYCQSVENPLAYSKFCTAKPFNVVRRDLKERDTCLCSQCENMELLISALHQAKVLEPNSNLSFLRSLCCSPRKESCYQRLCGDCKEKAVNFKACDDENLQVKFHKWESVQEKKIDSKSGEEKIEKRTIKKENTATIKMLKAVLLDSLEKFLSHTFRDKHQCSTLRLKRENLNSGEIYMWIDFSENYSCKYSREVQSHYYGGSRENVVLHSGRIYLESESHSFCTASECLRKDPSAIIAHILPILTKFMKPGLTTLHIQSDSPSTQYRNKDMFYLVTKYLTKVFPQLTNIYWNYSEAGHGKGAPDGVASKAKNTADLAIQNGQDVATFKDLVTVLKEKTKNLIIYTVDVSTVLEVEKVLPKLQPFSGTFQVHQFTWTKEHPDVVHMNSVSCYDCPAETECSHFKLQHSPWKIPQEVSDKAASQANQPGNRKRRVKEAEENVSDADDPEPALNPRKKRQVSQPHQAVATGDWVVVKYGHHWYPGLVQKVKSARVVNVNFMVKHQKSNILFLWPPKEDLQSVLKKDILYKLVDKPQAVDRFHFKVNEGDLQAINAILM